MVQISKFAQQFSTTLQRKHEYLKEANLNQREKSVNENNLSVQAALHSHYVGERQVKLNRCSVQFFLIFQHFKVQTIKLNVHFSMINQRTWSWWKRPISLLNWLRNLQSNRIASGCKAPYGQRWLKKNHGKLSARRLFASIRNSWNAIFWDFAAHWIYFHSNCNFLGTERSIRPTRN